MNVDQARRKVIEACLELADKGFLAGTGGNVSCRVDGELFAITPSGSDYYSMTQDDICVLRLDNLVQVGGERRPSIEHKFHAHVLRARPDCDANIHTHQPIASAYSLLGRDLDLPKQEYRSVLGKKAVCVGYAPSGTGWLASKLRKSLRPDVNAYFLRNHGAVCCGPDLRETVARLETLEAACGDFFRNEITKRICPDNKQHLADVLTLLATHEGMGTKG